ncbi:MAG: ThuA domain-containing protein, partial [Bryobacterales bacterium]|nr:ThuA domain-containing protein [Bryobacterales bacterium]
MSRGLVLAVLFVIAGSLLQAGDGTRILVVVGPSNHPPGSHEVAAGGRLLQDALQGMKNLDPVQADVVYEWPQDKALRESVSTVVFIGDTFPANRFEKPERNLADLVEMMDRGCGIVCLHYATGLLGEDVKPDGDHPLLRWIGGYFANRSCPHHRSIARVFQEARIEPAAPSHPVSRGWKSFTIHDEPYINNYFGGPDNRPAPNVTAFATSMLPPDAPTREIVAWGVERPDGGRGFGIVMPHFYKSWSDDDLRRFILNGIVWTAKLAVPPGGVDTDKP